MDVYEIHTRDINGNSTKHEDIRSALTLFKEDIDTEILRINIDGQVIRINKLSYDESRRMNVDPAGYIFGVNFGQM